MAGGNRTNMMEKNTTIRSFEKIFSHRLTRKTTNATEAQNYFTGINDIPSRNILLTSILFDNFKFEYKTEYLRVYTVELGSLTLSEETYAFRHLGDGNRVK